MKNKALATTIGAVGSYGIIKLSSSIIDPFTRALIGIILGFILALSQNNVIRFVGIGIGLASFLQLIDIRKGGRLSINRSTKPVFVLYENKGISELQPGQLPDHNIDGITMSGLNSVFKLADGIYCGISEDNKIKYSFGIGSILNKIRDAGLKDLIWVEKQTDKRWTQLYEKSI